MSSSGTARAGMTYNLTCTVFKTVDGLINSPTATWTNTSTGMAILNENGVTVSTTIDEMRSTSILTFDPLRTSHQGSFDCGGTLTSPAVEMALMPSTMEILNVQSRTATSVVYVLHILFIYIVSTLLLLLYFTHSVSTPDVVINVPRGPLFAGSTTPLILTCNISINSATDTDIAITDMDITWFSGARRLFNDSQRVNISRVVGSGLMYTSTLTISPLSTADSSFTCRAKARPPRQLSFVIESAKGEDEIVISIQGSYNISIHYRKPWQH